MGNSGTSRQATRIAALGTAAAIAFTAFGATAAHADERHKVSSGDTVSALAHRYGSTIDAIIAANRLNTRATIYAGSTITIPIPSKSTAKSAPAATATKTTPKAIGMHKVVSGDTVWDLSRKYGSSVSALIAANKLGKSAIIRVGQQLTIPSKAATTAPSTDTSTHKPATPTATTKAPTAGTHKVVSGDTVWDLALKYGSSVSAIADANKLGRSATIRVGQRLTIPGISGGATTVSNVKTSTTATGDPKLATKRNLNEFGDSPSGLVGDSFLGRTYSAPVVGAANQNKATLRAMEVPSKAQMQALIVKTAMQMGVDPALAQAVAYQESGFNMRAVSPANAIGAMQVIPTSGEWASTMVGRDLNLLIPADNVTAGVAILKKLQRNGTPLADAIGGYYQGETAVRKYGLYTDTKRYVASVQALMTRFK